MKKVFISFSSIQTDEAERICEMLENNNIKCFISTRDLMAGEEYAAQLLYNIDKADAMVLLLSKDSNDSPHVLREVEYAVSHDTPIIVYQYEEVELSKSMEYFLMTHQWITDKTDKDKRLVESIGRLKNIKKKSFNKLKEKSESTDNVQEPKVPTGFKLLIGIIIVMFIVIIVLLVLLFVNSKNSNDKNDAVVLTESDKSNDTGENTEKDRDSENAVDKDDVKENKNIPDYKVGEYVTFGTYYDTPIEWRIIKINEDDTMILLSVDILTMKIYDAAEGGEYNHYQGVDYWSYENHIIEDDDISVMVRGSNEWATSNIRTWLNSDKEVVDYKDQAPTRSAAGLNFYSNEPGFLFNFTDEEKASIVALQHNTSEEGVFLLSSAELKWLKDEGLPVYAKPSEQCLNHDNERYYYDSFVDYSHVDSYYWWLRDSSGEKANEVNAVVTEYEDDLTYTTQSAGASALGVRPAVCVDMASDAILRNEDK